MVVVSRDHVGRALVAVSAAILLAGCSGRR
jgi:uncharacterized lipoprotein YajG